MNELHRRETVHAKLRRGGGLVAIKASSAALDMAQLASSEAAGRVFPASHPLLVGGQTSFVFVFADAPVAPLGASAAGDYTCCHQPRSCATPKQQSNAISSSSLVDTIVDWRGPHTPRLFPRIEIALAAWCPTGAVLWMQEIRWPAAVQMPLASTAMTETQVSRTRCWPSSCFDLAMPICLADQG